MKRGWFALGICIILLFTACATDSSRIVTPLSALPTVPPTAVLETGETHFPSLAYEVAWFFSDRLHLYNQVKIVSVEQVEWQNTCLEIYLPQQKCDAKKIPGYRIILEAEGKRYEYHSDLQNSSEARLAVAPRPTIQDIAIVWERRGAMFCNTAIIGSQSVAFGACDGALLTSKLDLDATRRRQELAEFVITFVPFQAETLAGKVTFTGKGVTVAAQSEQRMIAEWAHMVSIEANAGRSGAAWGQVLGLSRQDENCYKGISSSPCDYLHVEVTGYGTLFRIQEGRFTEVGFKRLTAGQLAQLYGWMDRLRRFDVERADRTMKFSIGIDFRGTGSADATPTDIQEMLDLADRLFTEFK